MDFGLEIELDRPDESNPSSSESNVSSALSLQAKIIQDRLNPVSRTAQCVFVLFYLLINIFMLDHLTSNPLDMYLLQQTYV